MNKMRLIVQSNYQELSQLVKSASLSLDDAKKRQSALDDKFKLLSNQIVAIKEVKSKENTLELVLDSGNNRNSGLTGTVNDLVGPSKSTSIYSKPQRSVTNKKRKQNEFKASKQKEVETFNTDLVIKQWVNEHSYAHKLTNKNFESLKHSLHQFINETTIMPMPSAY